jgi:tetratricopeptide (TPR) repeat protein
VRHISRRCACLALLLALVGASLGGVRAAEPTTNEMGFAALEAGHFEQALELFHQALDECPNSPVIWNNLGCVYYRQGKYEKAKPCFEQAIRLNLSFSRALLNLAAVEFRQGEYLRAYRTYCLARKIDREYVMSRLRNAQSQGAYSFK